MIEIPKAFLRNTGEEMEQAQQVIEDFFTAIADFLINVKGIQRHNLEIKSGELAYHALQVTDDRVTYLDYRGRAIAGVFQIRNESNFIQCTFFQNLDGIEESMK